MSYSTVVCRGKTGHALEKPCVEVKKKKKREESDGDGDEPATLTAHALCVRSAASILFLRLSSLFAVLAPSFIIVRCIFIFVL